MYVQSYFNRQRMILIYEQVYVRNQPKPSCFRNIQREDGNSSLRLRFEEYVLLHGNT